MKRVRIGCSGWNYKDWRQSFYPKGLPARQWLERYAEAFDTVEINNTFYRLPKQSAVENWVKQTPSGFVFTVKASRYLTHIKRLTTVEEGVKLLYERIEPLAQSPKMGPVLWQLPGNFQRDDERLRGALKGLPKGRHCFEFRHPSWFCDEVYKLLRRHRGDVAGRHPPEREVDLHAVEPLAAALHHREVRRGGVDERAQRLDRLPYRHVQDQPRVVEGVERRGVPIVGLKPPDEAWAVVR